MRILTAVAAGGSDARVALSAALEAWSRGLDIRLRFLNIGIEELVVDVSADGAPGEGAAEGLAAVEAAILREKPALLVVHGGGAAALAAVITAAKSGVPSLRTAAGVRGGPEDGEERAADRLATVRLAGDAAAAARLRGEGLDATESPADREAWGAAAAKVVLRVLREG